MATLATVDGARVGPRSLETEGSGSTFLGRYHSGIYGDSRLDGFTAVLPNLRFLF